ncbi:hypothetical protein Afil01_01480 [Actinorhabdospora filicis]|uniref:Uncharacterized protein n=1 Tax=Actinorhabdospora filicis TaxID=1785913 RepID=A0A9W6SIM3_9ACTN|nr:hypothetical protein [Actinorhabdospora filicis]GLZ75341.1 hypothetical protein Afil01_01480 [Actinorhabdospora filicis]
MKALGSIADRVVRRFVPKASARAVCEYPVAGTCFNGLWFYCFRDRCDPAAGRYCTFSGYGC